MLSVHFSVLLNNCKQNITSLTLLVGTTEDRQDNDLWVQSARTNAN